MPAISASREVPIWKLFNDDLGSNGFRKDAAVIDKLAGDGNGKLSLEEIDRFQQLAQDPAFEKRAREERGGWVTPSIVRSEVARKQDTGKVAAALGYLHQVPQAIGGAAFFVMSIPLMIAMGRE